MKETTKAIIEDLIKRYPKLEIIEDNLYRAVVLMIDAYKNGCKMMTCGNGGSAADSMHIVGELLKGFKLRRTIKPELQEILRNSVPEDAEYLIANLQEALPAISLVGETAFSTAYANDKVPDLGMAQQLLGLAKPGDVLLAITTSGNSKNVVYAAQVAKAVNVSVIALTGEGGGKIAAYSDVVLSVPETETFKIQEYHLPIYHMICLALEEEFFGDLRG